MLALNSQGRLDLHHPLSSSKLKPGFLLVDLSRGSSSTLSPVLLVEFLVDGSLATCLLHEGGVALEVQSGLIGVGVVGKRLGLAVVQTRRQSIANTCSTVFRLCVLRMLRWVLKSCHAAVQFCTGSSS